MGGKSKIAKAIAGVIDSVRAPGQPVWDPFCGGLSTAVALSKNGPVWATDTNAALISMYRAVTDGWQPPEHVNENTYRAARNLPDTDPMKAFCGFACSFGGVWFSGYAACSRGDNYAAQGRRALLRDVPQIIGSGGGFDTVDFLSVEPTAAVERHGAVLYLDPPYAGTTGYKGAGKFDHARLVPRVREWSAFCDVFVSEYAFPLGECVWSRPQTTTVCRDKSKHARVTERLFFIPRGLYADAAQLAAA